MKHRLIFLFLSIVLFATTLWASKPQVIIGVGTGAGNFRTPFHQTYNRTLSSDTIYILTGWYFVDSTYSITIQPGTLIRGDSASGGTLIVKRGAKIFAPGTANLPIVFTSNGPVGHREPGDWGGVIILGQAPTNQPTSQQIEGGFATLPNCTAMYGGSDPNDNSGIFTYIRIEFAGIAFSQDNEINGLTFGGVGDGTTLHHIQVSFANDDDFEFFGGTVDAKYLVGWRSLDDCFDTDFGFAGRLQFMYTKRDPNIFDYSASGSSNGEESDNMGTAPYIAFPTTKARFSNWTLVGPTSDTTTTINSHWGVAAMLRRATHLSIHNSIMMGWKGGINIRDTLTQRACLQDSLQLRHISLAAPFGSSGTIIASSSPSTGNIAGFNPMGWFNTSGYGNIGVSPRQTSAIGLPAEVWNLDATNNPVPPTSSEAATAGTGYWGTNLQGDSFYDSVSYRGAFDPLKPLSQQWTAGWTNFDPHSTVYDDGLPSYVSGTFTPASIDFGSVADNVSKNDTITVTASGNISLVIDSVISTSSDFTISPSNATIPYGQSAKFVVSCLTTTPGSKTGKIIFYHKGASSQDTISVAGNVLEVAIFGVSPKNIDFGIVAKNASKTDTVVVSSTGNTSLQVDSVRSSAVEFTVSPTTATIVNGSSTKFVITYHPTTPGAKTGKIVFYHKGVSAQDTVSVSGDVVAAAAFDADKKTIDFGTVNSNITKKDSIVVTNHGTIDLTITAVTSSNTVFTVTPTTATVGVEASQKFYITFAPIANGTQTGKIAFTHNALTHDTITVTGNGLLVSVNNTASIIPEVYQLHDNYPNPFNPSTTIQYDLPKQSIVTLKVYSLLGQEIATLVNDNLSAGYHQVVWAGQNKNGKQVSSGFYIVRMFAKESTNSGETYTQVKKMLLLK